MGGNKSGFRVFVFLNQTIKRFREGKEQIQKRKCAYHLPKIREGGVKNPLHFFLSKKNTLMPFLVD